MKHGLRHRPGHLTEPDILMWTDRQLASRRNAAPRPFSAKGSLHHQAALGNYSFMLTSPS